MRKICFEREAHRFNGHRGILIVGKRERQIRIDDGKFTERTLSFEQFYLPRAGIDDRNHVRVNKRCADRRRHTDERQRSRRRNGAVDVIIEIVIFVIQRSDRRGDTEHFRTACSDDTVDASVACEGEYAFNGFRIRTFAEFVKNKIVDFAFRKRLDQFVREVHFF